MRSAAARTRYAADTDGMVCLLLDVRGRARATSLQVFSYGKGCVVSLPTGNYKSGLKSGQPIIRNETPNASRWAAVSVPRWLALREGLYGRPDLPPVESGFCRQSRPDTRTDQERSDDSERALAEYIVARENRHRLLPDQTLQHGKSDFRNGAISA